MYISKTTPCWIKTLSHFLILPSLTLPLTINKVYTNSLSTSDINLQHNNYHIPERTQKYWESLRQIFENVAKIIYC